MVFFILDGRTESWLYLLPGTDVSVFRRSLFRYVAGNSYLVLPDYSCQLLLFRFQAWKHIRVLGGITI
jgi:hypothetical protein